MVPSLALIQPIGEGGNLLHSNDNEALAEAWLAWLAAGNAAAGTLRMRRCLLRRFAAGRSLRDATGLDIQTFIAGLPGGAWSRQSYVATLRGFYRHAVLTGAIESDPTRLLPTVRTPVGSPKPVPEHVLALALGRSPDRTRLMLLLGAYAGLRRAEIAAVHSDDVCDTHLTVTGKGRKTRQIPIHPRLGPVLRSVGGWAFPASTGTGHIDPQTVARHVAGALGHPWTTHSLRHRFASEAYRERRDLRAVQQLLGHSSPQTTASYVAVRDDALVAVVASVS